MVLAGIYGSSLPDRARQCARVECDRDCEERGLFYPGRAQRPACFYPARSDSTGDATVLSPLRWFDEIAFGVFLRGATLRDLAPPIGAMSGLGLLFFVRGALQFRARFR